MEFLELMSESIHKALNFKDVCLQDWFSAYTHTETYHTLSETERAEVFNQYENIKYTLKELDDHFAKFQIGVYR